MSEELTDKSFYNMASAEKLGWDPSWFCEKEFGPKLRKAIKEFQKEHGLKADGLCGPMTYARIYTQRVSGEDTENSIIIDGHNIPISWPKVDLESYELPEENYKKIAGSRDIHEIVTHWDATLSSKHCYKILKKRGLSTHFSIDNDGTIYQMVDPRNRAWHAKGHNNHTIGIDFSNAYYLKYNDTYERMGFDPRPVVESELHGVKLGKHLGYYPVQIKAYKELVKTLSSYFNIKLQTPVTVDGDLILKTYRPAQEGKFNGIVCHYHLTRNKIDCAGLELTKIINEIKEEGQ